MDYMPDSLYQAEGFLYSAGLGFILGMIYDFFRAAFFLFTGNEKRLAMVRDLIYTSVCLFLTFIFLLVMCSGKVMLYAIVGEIIGAVVYAVTVSSLLFVKIKPLLGKFRRMILKICSAMNDFFTKICKQGKKLINFSTKNKKL